MSERYDAVAVRRIVVAVDASPNSQAALRAAVEMAARFQAELMGLFVEDINVLRVAELPFSQALGGYSAHRRRVAVEDVERHFRSRIRQMRRVFQVLAQRRSVAGTFRVARGMVDSEIQAAAREADVLIIGRVGWSKIRERQVGSAARAACCDDAPSVTLVLQEGKRLAPPILVVYDGSSIGDKGLMLGATLVDERTEPLRVLLLASDEGRMVLLRERAGALLRNFGVFHQYSVLTDSDVTKLGQAVQASGGGTLILPAKSPVLQENAVLELLEEIDIPVMLVR